MKIHRYSILFFSLFLVLSTPTIFSAQSSADFEENLANRWQGAKQYASDYKDYAAQKAYDFKQWAAGQKDLLHGTYLTSPSLKDYKDYAAQKAYDFKQWAARQKDYYHGKILSNPAFCERNYVKGYEDPKWWIKSQISKKGLVPVELPNAQELETKFERAGFRLLAQETSIINDLAGKVLSTKDVSRVINRALNDYETKQLRRFRTISNAQINATNKKIERNADSLLKAILPGSLKSYKTNRLADVD